VDMNQTHKSEKGLIYKNLSYIPQWASNVHAIWINNAAPLSELISTLQLEQGP